MQREYLRAETGRNAYHRAPLLPTPLAYTHTVTKEPAFRRQDQDGQVRNSTQNQTVRDKRVGDQGRWRRKSRIPQVQPRAVHRVTGLLPEQEQIHRFQY